MQRRDREGANTLGPMASARQIHVGDVPIGGGAPVAVQTMTMSSVAGWPDAGAYRTIVASDNA